MEQWSCNLRLRLLNDLGLLPAEETSYLAWAKTKVSTWFSDINTGISAVSKLSFIKFNMIDSTGHYHKAYSNTSAYTPVIAGAGASTPPYPLQIAHVVSLRTTLRGPRYRGRFYQPTPVGSLTSSTLQLSQTYCDNVASSAKTLIDGLNAPTPAISDLGEVSILSKFGTAQPVAEVWIGTTLDTQRSRRRQLDENYSIRGI